jgi:nitroreductase
MEKKNEPKKLQDLILKTRSYRRFHQHVAITQNELRELVNLGRLSSSGGNHQPLKYMLSWQPEKNAKIFPHLHWATYLKDWAGPVEGERPAAYIIILCDLGIAPNPGCDQGIAAQSIMLGAVEMGYGGCMLGAVDRSKLREVLAIPATYDIALVLALGKPRETVLIEPVKDGHIEYWRDERGFHHVPKRALTDIILEL